MQTIVHVLGILGSWALWLALPLMALILSGLGAERIHKNIRRGDVDWRARLVSICTFAILLIMSIAMIMPTYEFLSDYLRN